jgi:3-oxoacyl-[acyl-carrier protein] reductase
LSPFLREIEKMVRNPCFFQMSWNRKNPRSKSQEKFLFLAKSKMSEFMGLLTGKIALITGASKGIGRAIATKFAQEGAQVAFTYLSSVEKGLALEAELAAYGIRAKGYRSDASDFKAAEELVNAVVADFGTLDILVNNAGITRDNLLMRMTEESWDEIMNINLKSCFNTVKAATRVMMKAKSGSIINMTSVVGVKGNAGQANYAASKAGIIGFTKSVALELGSRNIRCNAVAPGFIETEMTEVLDEKTVQGWRDAIPMKRGGQPQEIADVCVFLGSEMSSYISGQVLHVNGAMYT